MESVYSVDPAPDGAVRTSLDVLSFLDTLVNSTEEQCFSARSRSTVLEGLPFGGVPTVLAINFIIWLVSRPGGCHVHRHRSPWLWCQRLAVSTSVWITGVVTATRVCSMCVSVPGYLGERTWVPGSKSFARIMVCRRWHLGSSGEIVEQE